MWCRGQVSYLTTSHSYTCDGWTKRLAVKVSRRLQSESEIEAEGLRFDPGGARACKAQRLGRTAVPIAHHSVMTF